MGLKQVLETALVNDDDFEIIQGSHPADIALHFHEIPEEQALRILQLLGTELAAKILVEVHESLSESLLTQVGDNQIIEWTSILPSDEAAYLLSRLKREKREEISPRIAEEDREDIKEILQYNEDQIGSRMQVELIALEKDLTVAQSIDIIREDVRGEDIEKYFKAYIVDGKLLVGEIPLLGLLLGSPIEKLSDMMQEVDYFVTPQMNTEEVANMALQHDELSIPVVNDDHELIGRLTLDDLGEVLVHEYEDDIGKMAGTGEEHVVEQFGAAIRERLPWLLLGLLGGILLAFLLGGFEGKLEEYPQFVFFVPLIMSMAGNVGIQSSSIVVRGLSTGEISISDWFPRLIRELKISFINGSVCSIFLVALSPVILDEISFGIVVSICLFSVMIIAGVIGVMTPLILKKINIEPAYSTGPFITVGNDVLGIAIYMGLGQKCLEVLT